MTGHASLACAIHDEVIRLRKCLNKEAAHVVNEREGGSGGGGGVEEEKTRKKKENKSKGKYRRGK